MLWNSRKFSQTIWTNSLCWDWGLALLFWGAKCNCNYNLDSSGSCSVHCGGPMETCEPCLWNAVQFISLCQFHSNVRIHPLQISPDQMRVKLPSEDDFDVHTKMIWISSIYIYTVADSRDLETACSCIDTVSALGISGDIFVGHTYSHQASPSNSQSQWKTTLEIQWVHNH